MTIDQMIDELIQREAGYVNNPNDRGGPTKYGITEQVARSYSYEGDMKNLPLNVAQSIYKLRYWTRPAFGAVSALMPKLAIELFDCGVNMGPKVPSAFLQRVLNVLNRQQSDYPDIPVDGSIGPMTLNAIQRLKAKRPNAEQLLLNGVIALKRARYISLGENNPSQETFEAGWLAREAV